MKQDTRFSPQQAGAMLDWLIRTPALLQLAPEPELVAHPEVDLPLLARRLSGQRRLGKRFETLVAAWIDADPRYQLLCQDQAIHLAGRTLGAPDIIVRDRHSGEIEHWELTVKFYLGLPQGWLGPGRNDWLEQKVAHLRQHQLPLLEKPEALPWLQQKGWRISRHRLLSRGMLFGPGPERDYLHPNRQQGRWYAADDLPSADWLELERWQWMARVDYSELKPLRTEISHPLLIARQHQGRLQRHFVVPTGWPEQRS